MHKRQGKKGAREQAGSGVRTAATALSASTAIGSVSTICQYTFRVCRGRARGSKKQRPAWAGVTRLACTWRRRLLGSQVWG